MFRFQTLTTIFNFYPMEVYLTQHLQGQILHMKQQENKLTSNEGWNTRSI